ncbi:MULTISPECIES: HlyD family secretion protein [unclassified Sphingomonas]|jgi:membrane fusion protein, multidrug efflux system|uniref:HlyD family secretion protein n=1 Tax=unclassified Sphingomonas TaxID=196159 RepID=UPI000E1031CE|nr:MULTISPECIES: HlyD family secretion protein [unclassified Sphingomonas]AXJ96636.1 HlyD family secretion protein [Sphingomonas sp. FARSPH]
MSDTPHADTDEAARANADTQGPADAQEAADAKPTKRLSPRAKLILLVLLAAVVVLSVLWYLRYESHGKFMQDTNDATIQADAVTVAPKVSGYVADVLVGDNQDVKAGQPLVRIDARSYRAQAAQAEAQVAQARATSDAARASINEQYATIAQAQAQLDAARTKAAHDAGEVARYRPLAAAGAETPEQLSQLELAARQSADSVRVQAAALAMQRRRIAAFEAQVKQGQAQAEGARAQLAAVNVDVGSTLIRAAIDGRIGDKSVTVGQFVQAGTRLMSVVPLSKLYVTANFKETQLALMRPGQPATIKVDALDGVELRGHVESVSPGTGAQFSLIPPQNATGNFTKIVQRVPVRVAIEASPDARRLLVPGLSVTVTVDTSGAKGQLEPLRDQQKQLDEKGR